MAEISSRRKQIFQTGAAPAAGGKRRVSGLEVENSADERSEMGVTNREQAQKNKKSNARVLVSEVAKAAGNRKA
jgi:hypothetical protein